MADMTPVGRILGAECQHPESFLAIQRENSGIMLWCDHCRRNVTKDVHQKPYLAKTDAALDGIELDALPRIGERIYTRCETCRRYAECEAHHIAPRAFFGDEAEQWPKVRLCDTCHDRWHSIVTPGLCTTYDAGRHAKHLLTYLGLEKARQLTKMLIHFGKIASRNEAA